MPRVHNRGRGRATVIATPGSDVEDVTYDAPWENKADGIGDLLWTGTIDLNAGEPTILIPFTIENDGLGQVDSNVPDGNDVITLQIDDDSYGFANDTYIFLEDANSGEQTIPLVKNSSIKTVSIIILDNEQASFIQGGNDNDNILTGSDTNDVIFAKAGNDSVDGADGRDDLFGAAGNDTLNGGNGDDYAQGGDGNDELYGEANNDVLDGLSGDDKLYGGANDDTLWGWDGNDYLEGNDGFDYLFGEGGNDTLVGGADNDFYIVDDTLDIIIENSNQGDYDSVYSSASSYTLGNNLEALVLFRDTSNINGTGNALDNSIEGNEGNNVLSGEDGNDALRGELGNDTLVGGLGNDTLVGGEGNDRLNGYGTTVTNDSQFDSLVGGAGADYFILGGTWGVSYVETGAGYAIITDWDASSDYIEVIGSCSQYILIEENTVGSSALDTSIYYTGNGGQELIGVVENTTDVIISRDFNFV